MRTALAAAIAALVILAVNAQGTTPPTIVQMGGVVRLGPDPYFHKDGGHRPVGIKRLVLEDGCDLRVVLANPAASRIVTAIADEDAQLGRLGVHAGIHGGAHSATVLLFRDGQHVCADDPLFVGEHADVWLSFVVSRP